MKFHFLIILFCKIFSNKSLPSSGTWKIENWKMTLKNLASDHTLEKTKSKVSVAYGRNSVSDLASCNDVATNGVNGRIRISNKTCCKCECCVQTETNIEVVCSLEIPQICKPRFSNAFCLYDCRSYPHFVLWCSWRENFVSYLISIQFWSLANRIKVFCHFDLCNYCFLSNILVY